ncbi:MAG: hypothetical protein EZS28_038962, partial [Streblomastix strix]
GSSLTSSAAFLPLLETTLGLGTLEAIFPILSSPRRRRDDKGLTLQENKMIIPFRGTQEEKKAYQEMLKEELEEGIVILIQKDQVKWWNYTFLIEKPNGTWRKILDMSKLNKEMEKLHFKMHGLEVVQYLVTKSFNFNNNNYACEAMHFGTKHIPIFFAEAIESIIGQIRLHSKVKILNYSDAILLIHQEK